MSEHISSIVLGTRSILSGLTDLFNWEALAAIGTVGALWFLAIQSTQARRSERAKSIGILTFLIGLVEPVEVISIYEDEGCDQLTEISKELIALDLNVVLRAKDGIALLSLDDASSVGVVEWVMALPLALKDIEEVLKTRKIVQFSSVFSSIRYVQEAAAHFVTERERIEFGLLHRVWRNIEWRWQLRTAESTLRKMRREREIEENPAREHAEPKEP